MGYRTLIETWVGMSWEEITDNWKPPAKKENYEAAVEGEKTMLANAILEGIIKRAQAGELDAVNWLEERGLLKLPSREVSKARVSKASAIKAAIESGVSQVAGERVPGGRRDPAKACQAYRAGQQRSDGQLVFNGEA